MTEDLTVTLTIHNVKQEDQGEYTIRLMNEWGSTECTVTLTLDFEKPSFIEPLKDQPVTLNETATLECKVTGRPEPETKWLVSGCELSPSDKYVIERINETARMSITSVTIDDTEMTYTCKAFNPAGDATSSANLVMQGLSLQSKSAQPITNRVACVARNERCMEQAI